MATAVLMSVGMEVTSNIINNTIYEIEPKDAEILDFIYWKELKIK